MHTHYCCPGLGGRAPTLSPCTVGTLGLTGHMPVQALGTRDPAASVQCVRLCACRQGVACAAPDRVVGVLSSMHQSAPECMSHTQESLMAEALPSSAAPCSCSAVSDVVAAPLFRLVGVEEVPVQVLPLCACVGCGGVLCNKLVCPAWLVLHNSSSHLSRSHQSARSKSQTQKVSLRVPLAPARGPGAAVDGRGQGGWPKGRGAQAWLLASHMWVVCDGAVPVSCICAVPG